VLNVGDVVGHNLLASVAMGQLRIALRVYAIDGSSPAVAITRLEEFVRVTGATSMATVLVGDYDRATRRLRIASAGHPPPVVIDAAGKGRLVELRPSPPVGTGLLAPGSVVEHDIQLAVGDTVLLYTDGLIERRGESLSDGMARLVEVACGMVEDDPSVLARRVVEELVESEDRRDDTALLVLRVER
jgi:serine phosphatase RsbU (regulator of sigma subunit)